MTILVYHYQKAVKGAMMVENNFVVIDNLNGDWWFYPTKESAIEEAGRLIKEDGLGIQDVIVAKCFGKLSVEVKFTEEGEE